MSLHYIAGFDTVEIGSFSVVIGGTVGSGTATVTPGTYAHRPLAAVSEVSGYAHFAAAVQTALNAVVAGWTVAWSPTTFLYTISHTTAFTLSWSGSGGANLRRALGFVGNTTSATAVSSTARPYYLVVPQISGRSQFSDVYEPDEIVEEAVADGGRAYGVAKETSELWCDWTQSMESKTATLARAATSAVPWTWEHLFKHCRMAHPIAVYEDSSTGTVHRLRADGASFGARSRARVVADYDDLWNVSFFTRDLGAL